MLGLVCDCVSFWGRFFGAGLGLYWVWLILVCVALGLCWIVELVGFLTCPKPSRIQLWGFLKLLGASEGSFLGLVWVGTSKIEPGL